MPKISVPPLKCQGIKTKIVPLILANALPVSRKRWLEPFLGSGVVALNAKPSKALLADLNPHLIAFYTALQNGAITPEIARAFLEKEGAILREKGEGHYYAVRERFNAEGRPLDFLFLSRGLFQRDDSLLTAKGAFNVPFCRKPERFAKSLYHENRQSGGRFPGNPAHPGLAVRLPGFRGDHRRWPARATSSIAIRPISGVTLTISAHGPWDDELRLHKSLSRSRARFILSTWHSNAYRSNDAPDFDLEGFPCGYPRPFLSRGRQRGKQKRNTGSIGYELRPQVQRIETGA